MAPFSYLLVIFAFTNALASREGSSSVSINKKFEIERSFESKLNHRSLESLSDAVEQVKTTEGTDEGQETPRRATGGTVHSLLVALTLLSFLGNGLFLVYVFFFSRVG